MDASTDTSIHTSYVVPRREWTGPRMPYDPKVYTLAETLGVPGMRMVPWGNIRETRYLQAGTRKIGILGSWPDNQWLEVVHRVRAVVDRVHALLELTCCMKVHRRGEYDSITKGPARNLEILEEFFSDPDVQRVARAQEYLMEANFSKLHALYTRVLDKLIANDNTIHRNFPRTCFAATTLNMARAYTLKHIDHLNLFCGLCAVFNTGSGMEETSG
ncbi:hypothetical protein V5O48_014730 [Marasmius crinis-equi]|uniref:Uncharacterized protein n=1 Tax=Marasmius crinis-equi TaxID=585013 RepID=A0ABR3EWG7_9AGAR